MANLACLPEKPTTPVQYRKFYEDKKEMSVLRKYTFTP